MSNEAIEKAILGYLVKVDRDAYVDDFLAYIESGKLTAKLKSSIMRDPVLEDTLEAVFTAQFNAMQEVGILPEAKKQEKRRKTPKRRPSRSGLRTRVGILTQQGT